ncbi:segregation and condensation protein A [Caldicoprobacter guelmensis]|uniref:segregation and condensation protein A n=1 Tax=Caldicoprobacter guelmensis TaxID=1170224 RepID=UPI00195C72A6|nr:segregation/condensation protein A [Caldicoprobacter guelmensis]MBM7581318.1 segregation and condensation protein A [Caldicoprobacter guelmensis]
MGYQVKLDVFEGPLDLLLHLISKAKINIEDISISEITAQYMEYLNQMQALDIDIASEFLVMAATLLHIKSCKLLPKPAPQPEEQDLDPQQQLIQRLKEYKRYKDAGAWLNERYMVYSNMYSKLPEEIIDSGEDVKFSNVTKQDLVKAMIDVLERKKAHQQVQPVVRSIKSEAISLQDRIRQITSILVKKGKVMFSQLVSKRFSRLYIVVTFLALLEMVNRGWIMVQQSRPFSDILIQRKGIKWKNNR